MSFAPVPPDADLAADDPLRRLLEAAREVPSMDARALKARIDRTLATPSHRRGGTRPGRWTWWFAGGLLAAGAAALWLRPVLVAPPSIIDPEAPPLTMAESPIEMLRRIVRRESPPTYPPITGFDTSRLRTGRSRYAFSVLLDGETRTPDGDVTLELRRPADPAHESWVLVATRRRTERSVAGPPPEEAIRYRMMLAPATLDLQRRIIDAPGVSKRVWEMRYTDTMPVLMPPDPSDTLRMKRYRFFVDRLRPSPRRAVRVADDLALLALMPGLPLARGWSGRIQIEEEGFQRGPIADDRYHSYLLPMRVAGERSIATRWGKESAWRVLIGEGDEPQTWWVSKATGEVLRVELPPGVTLMAEREALELPSRR